MLVADRRWRPALCLALAALLAGNAAALGASVTVEADGEDAWAAAVRTVVEEAVPVLEKVAGFDCPAEEIKVTLAKDGSATFDLDARYAGDGSLLVCKQGKHRGFRGHVVVAALARAFTEKVTTLPWLQEALAYLLAYRALDELPQIQHDRTWLFEVLGEARGAAGQLDVWEPRPVEGGVVDPEIALAVGYLYAVSRTLGDDVFQQAMAGAVTGGKGAYPTLEAFVAALDEAAGKPTRAHFLNWALAVDAAGEEAQPEWTPGELYDPDGDLLLNFEEEQAGTDPENKDSDGDGRLDGEEVHDLGTDPSKKDPAPKVPLDGNVRKWLRLKKFKANDRPNDAKVDVKGAELISVAVCADEEAMYVLLEADAFEDPKITYNLGFDRDGDDVFDYYLSFRSSGHRWLVVTHGQKDLSWAEYRHDERIGLHVGETHAELRIPLDAMRLEPKFTLLAFTRAQVDGKNRTGDAIRDKVDLDRFRH